MTETTDRQEQVPGTTDETSARAADANAFVATVANPLIAEGKLQGAGLNRAIRVQEETGEPLDIVLTKLGLVSESDLAMAMARALDRPLAGPADFPDTPLLHDELQLRFLRQARILPLAAEPDHIVLAMANPLDGFTVEAVQLATGRRAEVSVATPSDIDAALDRLYDEGRDAIRDISGDAGDGDAEEDVERLKDLASEAPVIRLVNLLIERAVEQRASDIHIEPLDGKLRVRYRVDGILSEVDAPHQRLAQAIVSRVKIMAKLNIAERRLPQDGRIRIAVRGKELDLRVSTTPCMHGEGVVLRILDRAGLVLDFASLGFGEKSLKSFLEALDRPHGILLVTGPTGSGKTTTLYTSLMRLNTLERKILTVEDPVEYQLDGVLQVQVKPEIGLDFARVLRSFLRQDPDIMMIGEIRDLETARIAVQSALTGHLVLTTLHTNDAAGAVTRLLDMGVPEYLLTSTLNGVAAQRLVRVLCTDCREAYKPSPELARSLGSGKGLAKKSLYRAKGCKKCDGTGYRGRAALIEMLAMSEPVRRLILQRADSNAIESAAVAEGMRSLYEDGLSKAVAGVTSIEEVLRVTRSG